MGQSFEVTGRCEFIGNVETYGNYRVQRLVLEFVDGEYTNFAEFDVAGKQLDFMNRNKIGDELTVKFSLSGRKYTKDGSTRYFNGLRAFYVSGGTAMPSEPEQPQMAPMPPMPDAEDEDENDDVPF